ncbi:MAG: hypothetical protein V3U29_03615 [Phycisphaeraceae bacterium]
MLTNQANTILLLAAVDQEIMPTIHRLGLQHDDRCCVGDVGGKRVVAAFTGIGRDRCRQAADRLIAEHRPDWIIQIGLAGSLIEDTPAGQVIQFNAVTDGSGKAIFLDRDTPTPAALDPSSGATPLLLSHNELAYSAQLKRRLAEQHGATAVDMESFHLAELAAERSIRLSVVRAISDPIDLTIPQEAGNWVKDDGTADIAAATQYLATHPRELATMMKLHSHATLAARKLADFVVTMLA